MPVQYDLYALNFEAMKNQLQNAPLDSSNIKSDVIIPFPNSNGEIQNYRIYEAPVMEKGLSDKFPDIKSYSGQGIEDPSASIRFSTTIFGLHVMSLSGKLGTFYIDTYTKDLNNYIVYSRKNISNSRTFSCLYQDEEIGANRILDNTQAQRATDGKFRQYRLALACTIEYAAFHVNAAGLNSGTLTQKKNAVLAAMVVTMTRVNGIYERDMSLRMNLVANNDLIIFIDSDSFSNTNANTLITQSQSVIDSTIGNANYDIGHTVSTGGGGLAGLGVVCITSSKARGITGSPAPVGDPYDIDYVAHEMGHQFGGPHTFNGTGGSCTGNRSSADAVEPGSGSTIMAYAGICTGVDVQSNSDTYFHAVSIAKMNAVMISTGNCAAQTNNNNTAPLIEPLSNYTIPFGTAYVLKGNGTDDDGGESLTYCWEQINPGTSTALATATSTNTPNFRSLSPSTSPNRYLPKFSDVLDGNLTPTWEVISNVARTLNFALTVRDNQTPTGGQTARRDMVVTVANVGPFRITSPNTENVSWGLGSTQTISWDVAGTTANGINTSNVNILLSTDGGETFSTVLAANTPNDGTETVTLPNNASPNCRIMIEAVGNIFYAVSKNIALGYTFETTCTTYSNNTPLTVPDGTGQNVAGQTVSKTIAVNSNGTISDVNVTIAGTHTFFWDLIVGMQHPDGTQVLLLNRNCNQTSTGFNVLFNDDSPAIVCAANLTGSFSPATGALSSYNDKNMNGTWTLLANDNYNGDTGTINNWSIEICSQVITPLSVSDNSGFNDLVIYPNPSNGNFTIQFTNNSTNNVNVFVHDIRGREIMKQVFENESFFNENIQLNNVEKGIYLVTLVSGNKKQVKKISIE